LNEISKTVTWQKITQGGTIYKSGNADSFLTGDWRVKRPEWIVDKCTQCMLCFPVCPDSSIPAEDGKRLDYDFNHCKGCGVCATVCPFDAIKMVDEINSDK